MRAFVPPVFLLSAVACSLFFARPPVYAQAQNSETDANKTITDAIRFPTLITASDDDARGAVGSLDRKIHFSAFAQGWSAAGLGSRIGSNTPGAPFYEGKNYGMPGTNGARLRRAEAAADGNLTSRWYYRGMIDIAGALAGGSKREVLQDLYSGYRFTPDLAMEIGRENIGLGVEGSMDDNRLITIARSIMSEDLPVHVGRLGDIRSTGAALKYSGGTMQGFIGIWNDPSSQRLGFGSSTPPFAEASVTYKGITRLNVSAFGGTHVFSSNGETTDRVGGALVWQRGPHLFRGEVEFARDYSAHGATSGPVGTAPLGGYFLYGYSISRRVQFVIRYDNFDEGERRGYGTSFETTETGIVFPHANHKLREYTLGINYYVDDNQKLQLNLIREDTEDNGAPFWGPQRTLLMAAFQFGYNSPTQSQPLRGANDPLTGPLSPTTNSIYLGANLAPTLGFAAGLDIGLPKVRIVPAMNTRISMGMLGNAHAPSIFGFPGTCYTGALDQVSHSFRVPPLGRTLYTGFGTGVYFDRKLNPGARMFVGTEISRNVGVEFIANITGGSRPYLTVQTSIPL